MHASLFRHHLVSIGVAHVLVSRVAVEDLCGGVGTGIRQVTRLFLLSSNRARVSTSGIGGRVVAAVGVGVGVAVALGGVLGTSTRILFDWLPDRTLSAASALARSVVRPYSRRTCGVIRRTTIGRGPGATR